MLIFLVTLNYKILVFIFFKKKKKKKKKKKSHLILNIKIIINYLNKKILFLKAGNSNYLKKKRNNKYE